VVTFLVMSAVHTMPGVLALLSQAATGLRAVIDGDRARCVAVIIEPAHPARIYPLLMSVYGLTARPGCHPTHPAGPFHHWYRLGLANAL